MLVRCLWDGSGLSFDILIDDPCNWLSVAADAPVRSSDSHRGGEANVNLRGLPNPVQAAPHQTRGKESEESAPKN